jgi:phosphomannomutase
VIGVSGVRGRVGGGLTPEVMARLAASHGAALLARAGAAGSRRVVVGRDSRTSGPMLRHAAVAGLLSVGCDVLDLGLAPTPTVLLAVRLLDAAGGLVVTASHNPIDWNAAKLVSSRGVFLTAAEGAAVLEQHRAGGPARAAWDAVGAAAEGEGMLDRHVRRILAAPEVDPELVRSRTFHVVLDACHGVGALLLVPLLRELGCRIDELHAEPTGLFPRDPEPVPANLVELGEEVRARGADLGLAVDPDGDRLALVDETGEPLGEDLTLALAVERVLGVRGERSRAASAGDGPGPGARADGARPAVVTNLSTSRVVEDAAARGGAALVRTRVGEIHVVERMLELGSVIGGEGNGGVVYPAVHPTRDAGAAAALALSLLAREGGVLSAAAASFPRYAIVKRTVPLARAGAVDAAGVEAHLRACGPSGPSVDRTDGVRFDWPAERAWLHVRASGTEPVARIIAEAPAADEAARLAALAEPAVRGAVRTTSTGAAHPALAGSG